MSKQRKYDPDFKREAVRLVIEDGMGVREVERSLGITYGVLKGWVQKCESACNNDPPLAVIGIEN
jgi:transposase